MDNKQKHYIKSNNNINDIKLFFEHINQNMEIMTMPKNFNLCNHYNQIIDVNIFLIIHWLNINI